MKSYSREANGSGGGGNSFGSNHKNGTANRFLPNSLKFISSCIKTASSGVRSAGASVAASIPSGESHEPKDQVLWASFGRIELGLSFQNVLLLGYTNGFQVLDVEDASNVSELASKRDDPVTFLQMQPLPAKSQGCEGFRTSHPLLLVVASDESKSPIVMQNGREAVRDGHTESPNGSLALSSTAVRFYSLRSHSYVHVLRFRSAVHMVRCSPRIVAIGLAAQIYCFDARTLENKFSVLTYPVPQLGGQGSFGVNMGYGPMDVGPRWLAYAPNNPLLSNSNRLSPKSLTPSPGVSPSTSPSNGSFMARYAMESSKQLAAGLINLSDMGYKTLSRYCQELVPDGSGSPVSSNSGWKAIRAATHSTDADTAGVVVVKDFVSRATISQFRAHTSPISALCFDPSGTMLVTASIHGHNINVFRIMPSSSRTGLGSESYDWCSSHVHLYKLHRGVTSAVIQDICFSHYSQWVAIITAKGTCHIFLLSPFGGETTLQVYNSHVGQPSLLPTQSLPWWSTPFFSVNQQASTSHLVPPPPITSYVASRIKNCSTGWLNCVSSVASNAAGKVSVPSGAFAAVFHSSGLQNLCPTLAKVQALEHLLVFTPSGHVVQYDLIPSTGGESNETIPRAVMASSAQIQDDDQRVKVEPLHWWDVCRRTNWPEREECISGHTSDCKEDAGGVAKISAPADSNGEKDLEKTCDRSHFYIANAEVQMSSGRIPIWQKPKIHFYTMSPLGAEELFLTDEKAAGELEIEKFSAREVEIRRKDPLPVFDHFQRTRFDQSQRALAEGIYSPSLTKLANERPSEDGVISYPKLDGSIESSNGSLENYYHSDTWSQNGNADQNQVQYMSASVPANKAYINKDYVFGSTEQFGVGPNGTLALSSNGELAPSIASGIEGCSGNSRGPDLMPNVIEGHVNGSLDFEQYFQEEYCGSLDLKHNSENAEAIVDVDGSSSPCGRDKPEEDADNDDLLGGIFDFSE